MYAIFTKSTSVVTGTRNNKSSWLSAIAAVAILVSSFSPVLQGILPSAYADTVTTTASANPYRASFSADYAARIDKVVAGILSRGKDLPQDRYIAYLGTVSDGIKALAQKAAYQNNAEVKNITDYIAFELSAVRSSISKGDTFMSDISSVVDGALSSGTSASVSVSSTTGTTSGTNVSTTSNTSTTTTNVATSTSTANNTSSTPTVTGTTGAAGKNAVMCNGALPANAVWNYYEFSAGFLGDDNAATYCTKNGGTMTSTYAGARYCGVYQAGMWYPKSAGMVSASDTSLAQMPASVMNGPRTIYQGMYPSNTAYNLTTRYKALTSIGTDYSIDKLLAVACEFSCKPGTAWNGSACTEAVIARSDTTYPGCDRKDVTIGNVTWSLCDVPGALSVGNSSLAKSSDSKTYAELSAREKMDASSYCQDGYHLPTEGDVRNTYDASGKDAEFFTKYLRFNKLDLGGTRTPNYGYVTAGGAPYYVTYHDTIYGVKWDFRVNDSTGNTGLNFRCVRN